MGIIKLHDKYFEPFISSAEIDAAIGRLTQDVCADLKGEVPVFVAILNGAFMFAADFLKQYPEDCEISFVKLASYSGTSSSGRVQQLVGLSENLEGRTVVVLEDIVDTGNTLVEIHRIFSGMKIKGLRVATLFYKPEAYKQQLKIDYIGMELPNRFIVGYGLDYDGLGRNLPEIYQLKEKDMINLVLFGKPGAGKGTQAAFLKEKYNLVHISTGEVFRYNIKNETELGKLAKTYIDAGGLVPDEVTINMLQAEVEKNIGARGFIFDGFPRTTAQAEALDNLLHTEGMEVNATIALEADDEVLINRLLERGKISGRSDDQDEEKIRNRFEEYNKKTAPLMNYYKEQGKFFSVNGIGSIEEITTRLSGVIENLEVVKG
ncbi:adenylate kinase [Sinomicrobium weinanense]|uniref:Adenylate kinase n=1 Tax=Sinomicrobium weinanense TaxID=2842200 RepID=A0A926Q1B0_9FLAO|nr:adenylate kinase [Sinomicrobium weinanense]MBC9795488.1 adenylate kinase [Sinomicrobium weinanense]MBU3123365.1 adenylate kinase [Sinomicrobium weinanense]